MQRIILHLDINSYFATVEQQFNPALRGKPVGVCATMGSYGCIIASSREAKQVGVKTGCRTADALKLCPGIVLLHVDPAKYRSTTKKIFTVLTSYSDDIEPYSIDEAFVNLTGYAHSFDEAAAIGREIKERVYNEVGDWMTNSMGIGPTRWLAKFASDTCEKGGILVLHQGNLSEYLKGRPLTEAWGIAEPTARALYCLGVATLDELAHFPAHKLVRKFGVRGYTLWANVNGIETTPQRVADNVLTLPKSIGHSHVLRKRCHSVQFHRAVLMRLAERTGRRLRALKLAARGIFVSVGLADHRYGGGQKRLSHPIHGSEEIFKEAWQMIEKDLRGNIPQSFAVSVFQLEPTTVQESFFPRTSRLALYKALDAINNRFGEETVVWGTLSGLEEIDAPDRIGFRKTLSVPTVDEPGVSVIYQA